MVWLAQVVCPEDLPVAAIAVGRLDLRGDLHRPSDVRPVDPPVTQGEEYLVNDRGTIHVSGNICLFPLRAVG